MNAQPDSADRELLGHEGTTGELTPLVESPAVHQWTIEGIDRELTPLQYHYLSLMKRLIELKDRYQSDPEREEWLGSAINKSIFSALRDCIEANVGDEAKDLLNPQQWME